MVTRGRLHVVNVEATKPPPHRIQVHRMMQETEVFFDLRMARIVPIDNCRTGELAEK